MKKTCIALFTLMLFIASAGSAFAQTAGVNATVRVNPLEVEIVSPTSEVEFGQWFTILVAITNQGTQPVSDTEVSINGSKKLSIKSRKKINFGTLSAKEERSMTFQAKANTPGKYIIQAEVNGMLIGQEITASDTTVISSTGTLGMKFLFLRDLFTKGLPRFFS